RTPESGHPHRRLYSTTKLDLTTLKSDPSPVQRLRLQGSERSLELAERPREVRRELSRCGRRVEDAMIERCNDAALFPRPAPGRGGFCRLHAVAAVAPRRGDQ
ncbi:MAG: hypothetical protein ABJB49_08360, partial [Nitrospirota bacterium]